MNTKKNILDLFLSEEETLIGEELGQDDDDIEELEDKIEEENEVEEEEDEESDEELSVEEGREEEEGWL